MKLIISNVSGVPIYEQIKQQIKAAILSGELQAEETLPSLRTLAKDLKHNITLEKHFSFCAFFGSKRAFIRLSCDIHRFH